MREVKKKKRGKKKISWPSIFVFMTSIVFLYINMADLKGGINSFILKKGPVFLNTLDDLPVGSPVYGVIYKLKGIPDYKHIVTLPSDEGTTSCFPIIGFKDSVIVCSLERLGDLSSIDQILTPRVFSGPLVKFTETGLSSPLKRAFKRFHNIDIPQTAFILLDGWSPNPVYWWFVFLSFILVICILSLISIIIKLKRVA